jgi:hypothetical protein
MEFKESQLYDWHIEPKEERGSSFFLDSTFERADTDHRSRVKARSSHTLLVSILLLGAFGVGGMLGLTRLLRGWG